MKEQLMDGEIALHQWILTDSMQADALTKEIKMQECMKELLTEGNFKLLDNGINKVQCLDKDKDKDG